MIKRLMDHAKRWPVIRHVRFVAESVRVERHYAMWAQFGFLPCNRASDDEALRQIWCGER